MVARTGFVDRVGGHRTGARRSPRAGGLVLAVGLAAASFSASPALAAPPGQPSVLHVSQIAQQDVPVLPGSEPDTLVEPDVAVSPVDPDVAVAVAHDGRYPDGGAVGIETSWTDDGGGTWHHQPLPGVTAATGGAAVWERASDPVVAFGPTGVVYVSTLVFDTGCDSGVLVSRSLDGGKTFARPTVAHRSATCDISDDKNWLVVDDGPTSPHRGRLYQFWTPFLADLFGLADGSPQALVYSDDGGSTWSAPVNVSPPHANTQDSQPMLEPNGTIIDSYVDYGPEVADEGSEAAEARTAHQRALPSTHAAREDGSDYPALVTAVSKDGGATWSHGGTITRDLGDGPPGFRCCLPSSVADPVSGRLYTSWNAVDPTKVKLSSSTNGKRWTKPVVVNRRDKSLLGVSSDVAAYDGTVAVSYGLTNADTGSGRFGRQFVVTSRDRGRHLTTPTAVGPQINYAYAAVARGIFPGDYVGSSLTKGRLYAAWAVSSTTQAKYHQVIFGATFDTNHSPLRTSSPTNERLAVARP